MASGPPSQLLNPFRLIWAQSRQHASQLPPAALPRHRHQQRKPFSTSSFHNDTLEAHANATARDGAVITAAPPFDLGSFAIEPNRPARIIPASPSYFTASPQSNDDVLLLRSLFLEHESLPTVPSEQAPYSPWLKLATYRSKLREPVSSSRYTEIVKLLARLNKIHPKLQPKKVRDVMDRFRRPDVVALQKRPLGTLDDEGRAYGMGRRKESTATVHLVEGSGEVMINGRSIIQAFPRLHDRESALWALKVTGRSDKYNIFALARGGGVTGQAESITLALGRALMVHEPALKPTLRKAGCLTSDARRVERKKPGRLKARKRPAWVKR